MSASGVASETFAALGLTSMISELGRSWRRRRKCRRPALPDPTTANRSKVIDRAVRTAVVDPLAVLIAPLNTGLQQIFVVAYVNPVLM